MVVAVGEQSSKHKSLGIKTAAVQMWKANVPLMTFRTQLKLTERTHQQILDLASCQGNPYEPEDTGDRLPQEGGGKHAQEAGKGH